MVRWRLVLFVLLPFAMGFYLSYLFRMINAVIGEDLASELALDAASLGLLTSVYFLAFAVIQIPVGSWLDRYGPRRVQSILLLIAAVGAALFGMAGSLPELVVARALIGFGVAAAMMAGVKALILWFPAERLPFFCGWFVMLGALGGVTATVPAELVVGWTGWRMLFMSLALLTVVCAFLIYWVVPEKSAERQPSRTSAIRCFATIYSDPRFWRLAPLSASCAGTAWAVQGLWAAPWLADVEQRDRPLIVQDLFLVAVAVCIGAMVIGVGADRLRRRGIQPGGLLAFVASISIAAHLALVLRLPVPSFLPWAFIAAIGCTTVLSYATLAQLYPKEFAGRANGALNVVHFAGAFVIQFAIGLIVEQWTAEAGRYPPTAYQTAFLTNLCVQLGALAWFLWPASPVAVRVPGTDRLHTRFRGRLVSRGSNTPRGQTLWSEEQRLSAARVHVRCWRAAAFGATTLAIFLSFAIARNTGIAEAAHSTAMVERHGAESFTDSQGGPDRLLRAQIEYFLTRFIENIRSIPADPVVMRANWISAYNYTSARGAKMLNEYANAEDPFSNVGVTTTIVEVISVVRLSHDAFKIFWWEETRGSDTIVRREALSVVASVSFEPTTTLDSLRENPIGLKVRWASLPVPVRVRSPAPRTPLQSN